MVKRLRVNREGYLHDESEDESLFELVELGEDEYTKMIKQLYRDIELCKKFREERKKSAQNAGVSN